MLIKKSKIWEYELIKYAATHIDPVNDDIMLVDQIATNKMTISSVKRQEFADRMTLIFMRLRAHVWVGNSLCLP